MGRNKYLLFKHRFFRGLILCFVSLAIGISPAFAQEDEFLLEEIVVTGSRIARNNNESTSPIVTVDETLLNQSATTAIETMLNKLPQFTPTIDVPQVAGQDIQPTATNSPGEATVALRGIGANRTLILINGRRGTPSNAAGVLDINTIPTAAIQYVEAISGGASSTYGADAMAGVLNFIMKDKYEGAEISAQVGMTQEGDNIEYNISGVMGANFDDGRGNIMMSFAYNDRGEALQRDRSWFRDNWKNSSMSGSKTWPDYPSISLGYSNLPDVNVLNDVMDLPEGQGFGSLFGTFIYYDPASGEAFSGFDANGKPGVYAAEALGLIDGYAIKQLNNGQLGQNNLDTYLIFPLERWNFYTQGNYELNDYVGIFGQAYFSKTSARTVQEGGVITGNQTVTIDPTRNRDAIPDEILAILDSRPNPDATFDIRALMPNNRVGISESETFNMTTGLEGSDIPFLDGWSWEAFVSYGESENTVEMQGMYSLERLRGIMGGIMSYDYDEATGKYSPVYWPDYKNFGEGLVIKGNEEYANFGGATATCTSGINPFDWDSVTQDCWDAVEAPLKSRQVMKQTIYEANAQGPVIELPTGEMRAAVGVSHRKQDYRFTGDNVNTEGRSWNDKVLGLNPAGEAEGEIDVTEGYAELLVPLLKDLPFAQEVSLNLGGRYSDYNTTGGSNTYKAQLDWRPTSFLRFRGGYNKAERAPNIAELYLARTMTFSWMSYGDVCSLRNSSIPWTANSGNENWLDIVALCGQKMEATGNADADYEYYGADWRDIVNYANANPGTTTDETAGSNTIHGGDADGDGVADNGAPILTDDFDDMAKGGFAWLWPIDQGNENLEPETADTWTVGFVLDSFVQDIPWLSDWRISVDYYMIKIEDAIGLQTADVVLQMCTDPTFNPAFDPNSPYCVGMERNSDSGGISNIVRSYYNNGRFKTSGLDFQINWGMDVGPGRLSVSTLVNYLLEMKSSELPTNPLVDYVGTFGPTGNGLNGNSFEWRALTTFTYSMDNWDASLRWQFLDELENISGDNSPLEAYHMFDLLGNWRVNDSLHLRFGIENVFNIEPELYNIDYDNANDMYGGSFSTQLHDVNGRRFYVGMKIYFK